jgi:hypothetical protein
MVNNQDQKQLMLNSFKTQFPQMPEDLRDLRAKSCLSLAIKMHKAILRNLSEKELSEIEKELS